MKLYQSVGPNPRVVLMYLAETGFAVDRLFIDIMNGENRREPFVALSPIGHTPLLEMASGQPIAESLAICEYLDEHNGHSDIIGRTAEDRAVTRMFARIVDQQIVVPMTMGFRGAEGQALFASRLLCLPDAAADLKRQAAYGLGELDRLIGDGPWVAGDRFSLADILLFSFAEFGKAVGQPPADDLTNLAEWHARVSARASAAASANPKLGMGTTE